MRPFSGFTYLAPRVAVPGRVLYLVDFSRVLVSRGAIILRVYFDLATYLQRRQK